MPRLPIGESFSFKAGPLSVSLALFIERTDVLQEKRAHSKARREAAQKAGVPG